MTPELWQRLKPLYDAALETPPEKRANYVAQACRGDDELRKELEVLLAANDGETTFLDAPLVEFHGSEHARKQVFSEGDLLLGRFRIVRCVGTGGMGEVYEAIDLELGRIALKTIRSDITERPDQLLRFKKEVQLARSVSSPHICRIHELFLAYQPSEGQQNAFLTMEFLDGITLADKIRESGPMPWRDARTIVLEACAALEPLHKANIIHRDLKTRNIMLASRSGITCAVLMDFGIAYQLSGHAGNTSTALTRKGEIVGTPGYMAPEQYEGKEATPSSDIYALGIVAYELLTGKHPFSEDPSSRQPVTQRVRPLIRPSSIEPSVPRRFEKVVCKCLEYDPKRRYQSANEVEQAITGSSIHTWVRQRPFAVALQTIGVVLILFSLLLVPAIGDRVRGILFSSREKHIAVLPLDIVGENPETQALGDGLMDSLAGKLANLDAPDKSLWVVPASEVRSRKVSDPASALREFGATIVVKGVFDRNEHATHLKLALIDPKKTREIGFVDVDSQTGDLGALQDAAVTRLGRLMNLSVKEDSSHVGTEGASRAAYEDYLEGLGYFQRYDKPGNIEFAITSLNSSVNKDPGFAIGFARLAEVYIMKYHLSSDGQYLQQAEQNAKRAAELDDRIPSTYVALGQIHDLTGNNELAIQEFQRALSLNPRDSEAIAGLAKSFRKAGHQADAEAAYIKAATLRPNDWKGYNDLGIFYLNNKRPHEAITQFQHALELTPDNSWPYANLGLAYMNLGDPQMLQEAERALNKSIAINPTFGAYANLGVLYLEQHRFHESAAASQAGLRLNDKSYQIWVNLAIAYQWLGEENQAIVARGRAIELLERSVRVNPDNADARATLANLDAGTNDRKRALDNVNISLALAPDSAYVLWQVAETYELLGDREEAVKYLRQALLRGMNRLQLKEDVGLQGVLSDPAFRTLVK